MGPKGKASARSIGAVVAGVVAWSVLWIVGGPLVVGDAAGADGRVEDAGVLWGLIALSAALSPASGALTGVLAGRPKGQAHGLALGGVLLALGLVFEITAWSATPAWYHLVFLALLVPACLAGERLASRRRAA